MSILLNQEYFVHIPIVYQWGRAVKGTLTGRRANYGLQSPPLYDKLLKYIPELV
jgi:hypothetical protein